MSDDKNNEDAWGKIAKSIKKYWPIVVLLIFTSGIAVAITNYTNDNEIVVINIYGTLEAGDKNNTSAIEDGDRKTLDEVEDLISIANATTTAKLDETNIQLDDISNTLEEIKDDIAIIRNTQSGENTNLYVLLNPNDEPFSILSSGNPPWGGILVIVAEEIATVLEFSSVQYLPIESIDQTERYDFVTLMGNINDSIVIELIDSGGWEAIHFDEIIGNTENLLSNYCILVSLDLAGESYLIAVKAILSELPESYWEALEVSIIDAINSTG